MGEGITGHMRINASTKSNSKTGFYHITIGDGSWEPTADEFEKIADLFSEAMDACTEDCNPLIITRDGVNITFHEKGG